MFGPLRGRELKGLLYSQQCYMHSQLVTVQSALSLASVIDAVYLNIGERGAIKVESHVHGQMQKYLIHHHVLQSHKEGSWTNDA